MRVKWNRQLDGSLARRQAEEAAAAEEEERKRQQQEEGREQQKQKDTQRQEHKQKDSHRQEHKQKESPKLFRLFRRKKRRAPVDLPQGAPFAPTDADEDDCASISSVATVASQPTADVCQRDRTMSIFSSFRLNFPKKKSKRTVAADLKEPSRYSSPDLRRDGPCGGGGGGQLSSSSPSVKGGGNPSRRENDDLVKHSSASCFVRDAQDGFGGQGTLSKSSPAVDNSAVGFRLSRDPFDLMKQSSIKQDVKMTRDTLGDSQIEMSKSTPSVKVGSIVFEETSNSLQQLRNNCTHQDTMNTIMNTGTGLKGMSMSASVFDQSATDLHKKPRIVDNSPIHNNSPNSISFDKNTCDLESLERLRMDNSNSLDQLKRERCTQKNMRSAKSVSFLLESSLSPSSDVTSVAEAGVFPTVNEEAIERKSHSAEPSCRGKSTSDDCAQPFHNAVYGDNSIEKAVLVGAPDGKKCGAYMNHGDFHIALKNGVCRKRNIIQCDVDMKNGDFHNNVCTEDHKLELTGVKRNSEDYCVKVCDQQCVSGAQISKSIVGNGDMRVSDFKLNSENPLYFKENYVGVYNAPAALDTFLPHEMHNEVTTTSVTTIPTLDSIQTKDSTNLYLKSCVINEGDVVKSTTCIEHRNDIDLKVASKQIESPVIDANSYSVSKNVDSCEFTRELGKRKRMMYNEETSAKEHYSSDFNKLLNINSTLPAGISPETKNYSQFCNSLFEIQSNNCDADVRPKTQLFPEYPECHNHSDLHISNCHSDFFTNSSVTEEDFNNFFLQRSLSQCLNNSNIDYSNVSDSLVQLSLIYADGLISEHDIIHPPEIKKKSILHSKPSDIQLDFLKNNALSCVGSYLRKLTETGSISENYFDSSRQTKSVWNASLVQNIISRHFPTKGWLLDPSMDVGPPLVATVREKNPIVPERCPDLSSAPIPTTVTVAEHDLHMDTPGYSVGGLLEQNNIEAIPNDEKTSFRPFFDVQKNVPVDIYDDSFISSLERCDCDGVESNLQNCNKNDTESTHRSYEKYCVLSGKCVENEPLERYVSEQKFSKNLFPSHNDTSVNIPGTTLDNFAPKNEVDLSVNDIPSPEIKLVFSTTTNKFIDALPEGGSSIKPKNGLSCEYESGSGSTKFKIDTWSDTISKSSADEITNDIDVADGKMVYQGVKNKIKMFESGSSDVPPENTQSKSNKLEQFQKKNCVKGKISMIPSLKKGIPTAIKNSHIKSSKVKSQIQKNKIKDPEKICRKSPNESQHRLVKSPTDKNFSKEPQIETRLQSDRNSSKRVHKKSLDLKLNSDKPNILISKNNIISAPGIPSSYIIPGESSPTPEFSERSKSEEFLLNSKPESPVSNLNTSFRRHSAAAVSDFFHQNITNHETLENSAQIDCLEFKLSEKSAQFDSLEFNSSETYALIDSLEFKSPETSAEISSLDFMLSEKSAQIDSLDLKSSETSAQISSLEFISSDKSTEISHGNLKSSQNSSQMDSLDLKSTENSAQIDSLDLKSSEKSISNLEFISSEKENSAQIDSFDNYQSSNLTLEEVSLSLLEEEEDSSSNGPPSSKTTRGLHERRSSLPLVIGQVQASRNSSAIKDGRRGSTRIPTKHAVVSRGGSSHLSAGKPSRPALWLSKAELSAEIQRLGTLCEARTKELNRLKMETRHVTVGFDAFAALFKYIVEDVNGLSVPKLSEDLSKTLKQLELAKQDLAYYEREVEEMKAHHCQELNDLSNKLFEVFQGEVTELGAKHQEEVDRLKQEHEMQLQATSETYKVGYEATQACHEAAVMKLQQELITQREELELQHARELHDLELQHKESSRTLQEHADQLQKKCAELKHHSLGMEDAMRKDTDSKLQWVTSRKGDLEKEVESLKAVLEMKNKELHTLRVQNLEMDKQLEELPLAREKIKMLSARAEDLEALMAEKTRLERQLCTENASMREVFEKESKVNRRLSMENEELQWRLRQAEHSIVSGSFSEVPEECAEESSETPLSPMKSPLHMSRSVFFTFVDKDTSSSPRSQYKKITPGFSTGYKTSPSKTSTRARGLSEPMHPTASTPKKTTGLKQKRQRAIVVDSGAQSTVGNGIQTMVGNGVQSFAGSMVSSVGSEGSVFDQEGELLLEEHKEQIMETLEILREQRCSEENDAAEHECLFPDVVDAPKENGECLVPDGNIVDVPDKNGSCLVSENVGDIPCEKDTKMECPEEHVTSVDLEQNGDGVALVENQSVGVPRHSDCRGDDPKSSDSETSGNNIQQQNGKGFVLGNGPESVEGLQQPAVFGGEEMCFPEPPNQNGSDPVTPFGGDEMSRSAEFSDPKTYYHMTFPVLKEAGAEDTSPTAQETHSSSSEEVVRSPKEGSSETVLLSLRENGASGDISQRNALSQSCHAAESVQDQSREKNRWRTM